MRTGPSRTDLAIGAASTVDLSDRADRARRTPAPAIRVAVGEIFLAVQGCLQATDERSDGIRAARLWHRLAGSINPRALRTSHRRGPISALVAEPLHNLVNGARCRK